MYQSSVLPSTHTDLITTAAYDWFGKRLVTASSDQQIKVWSKAADASWNLEEEWKAHDAPIARVAWSHPEHGSLIASCSFDRTVRIFEENSDELKSSNNKRWSMVAKLSEARGSVRDLAFGPSELGLRLATISSDSYLRLYSPALPSVEDWYPLFNVHLPSLTSSQPTGSSPSVHNPSEGGISRTKTNNDKSLGLSVSTAAGGEAVGGGRCLSWCKEKWWGMILAVGEGTEGEIKIISLPHPSPAQHLLTLTPPSSQTPSAPSSKTITSLSWAPSCGRDHHLIASGSRDGIVRIWKVTPTEDENGDEHGSDGVQGGENGWKAACLAELGDHGRSVSKVEWNATGTVLSSSGDDGKVRLWKATYSNRYECMATFDAHPSEETSVNGGDAEMM
ncbi:Nuclear pore complex component (sc Seh1) [Phaffia rhodozyma]|uniref:Nuclear pore complex component (Sc Seh1) n=1 Tax=Phaffia rhodozyma TaxID=264483 RepID=A0A0F7SNY1_PHARH|nr:Nuclear pore complex component (sc Seh1) [Phaffia rhodozyma]